MTIDLSIVIVNYNVRHFLRQTLESIERATQNLRIEVFVVDNNSADDSVEMVKLSFPHVKLIENKNNPGFSKANNQAIKQASGKYILLLNPDTILQEDTLVLCFEFMNKHTDAGAVGAKMLDGSGQFLPESKRGFPSPWVSFCKATGLSVLFPHSKTFNQYHLGFLDENETHEIDVLCGAFMFMRKSVLDEIGLLDEAFFMYGEDIDLSYRIKQADHKIYYYPDTKLIHFKGESTKKSSVNYVRVFYQAMIIFAKKHFAGKGAGLLVMMLNIAIFGRASLSLIKRIGQSVLPQIFDFTIILLGIVLIKEAWESLYFKDPDYFNNKIYFNFIVYGIVYVVSMTLHGIYRKNYRIGALIRSILIAVLILLALYGLVPTAFRFSRALLLFSGLWALFSMLSVRLILRYIRHGDLKIGQEVMKKIFVIGSRAEAQKVLRLLEKSMIQHEIVGKIAPENQYDPTFHTSKWSKIKQLTHLEKANEFIFCVKDFTWHEIIGMMNQMGPSIEYKMVGDDSMNILGSKSKNSSGELYSVQFQFNISKRQEQWKKRILDLFFGMILLLFSFVLIWSQTKKSLYFQNIFSVLAGKKSMVSYDFSDKDVVELPELKKGLLNVATEKYEDQEIIHRANLLYAKDYSVWKDVEIILRNLTKIS